MARSSMGSTVLPKTDEDGGGKKRSRRELLRVAGAAVAGAAAGGLAAAPIGASAATGGNMIIGAQNDENSTTSLVGSSGTTLDQMFRAVSSGQTNASNGLGAIQAIGNTGAEGVDATCFGANGWAFFGQADLGIGCLGSANFGAATGVGTYGVSGAGYGAIGTSSTGVAVGAQGNGRLQQNPNIAAGPPAYAPVNQEQVRDGNGVLWLSNQGTYANGWAPAQPGATWLGPGGPDPGTSLFTISSNQQYHLTGSNGVTWVQVDPVGLKLTIVPTFRALAILTANSSLWTDSAGFNQDLAIFINGALHSWQESGGFAGTFSPNAVAVHGVYGAFERGLTYTVDLRWKANKPDPNTIYAGAGSPGAFSPTRLTVQLVIIS